MKPLRAVGDWLARTPWWLLFLVIIGLLVVASVAVVPFNTMRIKDATENPEVAKMIEREVGDAYERAALRTALGLASRFKGGISEEIRREIEEAIDELKETKGELRAARAELERLKKTNDEGEIEATKAEVARLEALIETTSTRIGNAFEAAFGKDGVRIDASVDEEPTPTPTPVPTAPKAPLPPLPPMAPTAPTAPAPPAPPASPGAQARAQAESAKQAAEKARADAKKARADAEQARKDAAKASAEAEQAARDSTRRGADKTRVQPEVRIDKDGLFVKGERGETIIIDAKTGVITVQDPKGGKKPDSVKLTKEGVFVTSSKGDHLVVDAKTGEASIKETGAEPVTVSLNGRTFRFASDTLDPDLKTEIEKRVRSDLVRAGVGISLVPFVLILAIVAIIAKIFIGRARAAQKVAEQKITEADFARMNQQMTQAKLAALQAQVEPHFLYNTLANVQALTEVDAASANKMTGHLIDYLRAALPKMRESASTVGQEIELVRAYLNILKMRMGKRLTFDITVPQGLVDMPFPPLMLPSLVENAIKHGLEPQREGGTLQITAVAIDQRLRVSVADTGKGFGEGAAPTAGTGVGLANIRERLAGMYGDAGKLILEANSPKGTIATIEIPLGAIAGEGTSTSFTAAGSAKPAFTQAKAAASSAAVPRTWKTRTGAAFRVVEKGWRTFLWYAFLALVAAAAIFSTMVAFGVSGLSPTVVLGEGTAITSDNLLLNVGVGILLFVLLTLIAALVVGILYGLGFIGLIVLIILAVFVIGTVLVSILPLAAVFAIPVLIGLGLYWLYRRWRPKQTASAAAVEPRMGSAAPSVSVDQQP